MCKFLVYLNQHKNFVCGHIDHILSMKLFSKEFYQPSKFLTRIKLDVPKIKNMFFLLDGITMKLEKLE